MGRPALVDLKYPVLHKIDISFCTGEQRHRAQDLTELRCNLRTMELAVGHVVVMVVLCHLEAGLQVKASGLSHQVKNRWCWTVGVGSGKEKRKGKGLWALRPGKELVVLDGRRRKREKEKVSIGIRGPGVVLEKEECGEVGGVLGYTPMSTQQVGSLLCDVPLKEERTGGQECVLNM
ncbi:hypothetical protein NDU88_004663 [Pleurodeles waltl]|uniref:Uncharacterized protein n=1 Tax=Pleurodeles waltl TaxID=8319 RepID=A0AAV7WSI0_PLEWA|nr:hypothetical protein NDU88_004663 [Pleurodeles waltl]